MDQAVAVLGEALGQVKQTEQRVYEAELRRLKGAVLLARTPSPRPKPTSAEPRPSPRRRTRACGSCRAATSLARLWLAQDKPREAWDLLRPVYAWFNEGFDTPDLKEVKALLEELALGPPGSLTEPSLHSSSPVNNPS